MFPERLEQGYTLVFPGIWGNVPIDYAIVSGLQDADVPSAIELHDWTSGPLLLVQNLRGLKRNRAEARKIAAKIVRYQDQYPGRPVHLIGYSGGGGMAVLTLEALPPERKVTSAILLAPTLAADRDLQVAMDHTDDGIHNFYSSLDVPILMVLGTAVGTTDGDHSLPAGAVGFDMPARLGGKARRAYQSRLHQQEYNFDMLANGHLGGHFGWTNRSFVARRLAPLIAPPAPETPPVLMANR